MRGSSASIVPDPGRVQGRLGVVGIERWTEALPDRSGRGGRGPCDGSRAGEDLGFDGAVLEVGSNPLEMLGGQEVAAEVGGHDFVGGGLGSVQCHGLFATLEES